MPCREVDIGFSLDGMNVVAYCRTPNGSRLESLFPRTLPTWIAMLRSESDSNLRLLYKNTIVCFYTYMLPGSMAIAQNG